MSIVAALRALFTRRPGEHRPHVVGVEALGDGTFEFRGIGGEIEIGHTIIYCGTRYTVLSFDGFTDYPGETEFVARVTPEPR